jgi:antitoxin component YwqK of YwqJK toxin-antitoxin module
MNHTDSNGLKQGPWEELHIKKIKLSERNTLREEQTERGHYKDSLREGTWLTYNKEERIVKETTYLKGELEGPYKVFLFSPDFCDTQGQYKANKREGFWVYNIGFGQGTQQGYYKEDKAIGIWERRTPKGAIKSLRYQRTGQERPPECLPLFLSATEVHINNCFLLE